MAARKTPELGTPGPSRNIRDDVHVHGNEDLRAGVGLTCNNRERYGSRADGAARNDEHGIPLLEFLALVRAKFPPATATCASCGRGPLWGRSDTRYCSNACRQRAYRQRKAVS
jgi:hypothetical protein